MNRILSANYLLGLVLLAATFCSCDPGWQYYLRNERPNSSNDISYNVDLDSLTLCVSSSDFIYTTLIEFTLTPKRDSVIIHPLLACIVSLKDSTNTRVPLEVRVRRTRQKSDEERRSFRFRPQYLVNGSSLSRWQNDQIEVLEYDNDAEAYERLSKAKQTIEGSVTIKHGEELFIEFAFKSFVENQGWSPENIEDGAFTLFYPLFGQSSPFERKFTTIEQ